MTTAPTHWIFLARSFTLLALCVRISFGQSGPIVLEVDATEAPRKILHARQVIPAQAGPLTLLYPKWIPGEHGPTGPIIDLAGLKFSAAGKPLAWRRDLEDMYAFHLEVPAGADAVEVSFDFLLPPQSEGFSSGASATAQLVVISWNQVLLYPKGTAASELIYATRLRLPSGWKFGTALPLAKDSAGGLEFSPVSLETLVDAPLLAGAHFRTIDLTAGGAPAHRLHIAADSAAALAMKPEDAAHFSHLVAEANALFGAHHYRSYQFLLTLSENVAHFGLEHHESSDNRTPERMLIDEDLRKLHASLDVKEDGAINDVISGLPADKAGIAPGMKLVAVNGRRWTPAILRAAVKNTKTETEPLELLVVNGDFFKTYSLDYHGGEKYPHLERDAAKPDLLTQILKPLTPAPTK